MKANQVATLVLRLMGIYFLVTMILEAPMMVDVAINGIRLGQAPASILSLFSLIAVIVIGALLIAYSVPWGRKLIPKDAGEEKALAISFEQVQALAFAVCGIMIFSGALSQIFTSVSNLLRFLSSDRLSYPAQTNPQIIEYSAAILLKAVLGLWLFFGANGFANFWRSTRNFGTPKPPQTQ